MATIVTEWDTQTVERTGDSGGVISGQVTITSGTTTGDAWPEMEQRFKKVWVVLFENTETTEQPITENKGFEKLNDIEFGENGETIEQTPIETPKEDVPETPPSPEESTLSWSTC